MVDKRVKRVVKIVDGADGWRVRETKKGYQLIPPDRSLSPIQIHKTPSDRHFMRVVARELRARGFHVPPDFLS